MNRRKLLKKAYNQTPRLMGVYRIFNRVENRSFFAASKDLQAAINRHQAELKLGSHRHKVLQSDWNRLGNQAFSFSIIELLEPLDTPEYNPAEDLEDLLQITLSQGEFATALHYNQL